MFVAVGFHQLPNPEAIGRIQEFDDFALASATHCGGERRDHNRTEHEDRRSCSETTWPVGREKHAGKDGVAAEAWKDLKRSALPGALLRDGSCNLSALTQHHAFRPAAALRVLLSPRAQT
jgi:hypothetical protein